MLPPEGDARRRAQRELGVEEPPQGSTTPQAPAAHVVGRIGAEDGHAGSEHCLPRSVNRYRRAMPGPVLTRALLVETAEAIVRAEGMGSLGLRRLAREVGVTAPALYGHVENLEDVQRAVAERQFEALMDRFGRVRARSPEKRVRALSQAYVDYSLDEPNLFKLLFVYPPDIGGTGIANELPAATKVFLAAAEPVEQGIRSGAFGRHDPIDASLAVWAAVHGCATALSLGFGFDASTRQRLVDNVLDMVVAGLKG